MEDVRWPAEQLEEHRLEVSNRIRNLFWTVSGDYDMEFEPDTEKYVYSKQTVLYEAVKQGAFARYFDQKKLGMYLMKKLHFSAGEDMLLPLQRFRNYEEPRETNERILYNAISACGSIPSSSVFSRTCLIYRSLIL